MACHGQVAKTTIARIETAEGSINADQLPQILRLYKSQGVSIDYMLGEEVTVKVDQIALRQAQVRLSDSELRRSDRKRPLGIIEGMRQQPDAGESKGLINSFIQKSDADD